MKYKFGSIGAGNMGGAILQGALKGGALAAQQIAFYEHSPAHTARLSDLGCNALSSELAVWENCETVMLAVKPQGIGRLLDTLSRSEARPLVVSIVTGVTEERIHTSLPGVSVVRAMPNTPLLLGCGATAVARGKGVRQEDFDYVLSIFSSMGLALPVPDSRLCEAIPLNGSSPAFVYYFIDALAKWGERRGIEYKTGLALAAKTFEGAAKMVLEGDDTPSELIRKVCSPGGATLEGMRVLSERNVSEIMGQASDACVERAYQLGK